MDQGGIPSATPSARLPATSQNSNRFREPDAHRCFARLAVAHGDGRVADPAQRTLLAREWVEALGHHEPWVVNAALGRVIRECRFWPSIAEMVEACKPLDTRTAEERFGARHPTHSKSAPHPQFARDGRTEAEEVAHRTAQVLAMRRQPGLGAAPDPLIEVLSNEIRPASQAGLTPEFIKLAKRQGIYRGAMEE